ncbi:hypothetical protein ACN47E_009687 [Coniothyrium glycines]
MASFLPTPELSGSAISPTNITPKSQRILACVLCQRRKVKCDRRFPCANCTKAGAHCVSAALLPRQRRRRFPEKELLERLRHYESLLRQHHVTFEPLHAEQSSAEDQKQDSPKGHGRVTDHISSSNLEHPGEDDEDDEAKFRPKNFWHAMNQRSQHSDNDDSNESDIELGSENTLYVLRERMVRTAWNEMYARNEHLLFCQPNMTIELGSIHPSQALIFKLWQTYLDNVNPLLKVTHVPTLQARLIDAIADVTKIQPPLEALMFAIYCVAVFSLDQEQCWSMFGTPRHDVLRAYQLGAREALIKCEFLKTTDLDCLTALHLYLLTVKPDTDPRALASMLGIAIRIAQRLGIHTEAMNNKYNFLEAEIRRRVWWSLVLFDARLSEMSDLRLSNLVPTWDCRIPLNVNDSDLRPDMKNAPPVYSQPSETIFAIARCEMGEFTRHDPGHLDFVNPVYKLLAKKRSNTVSDAGDIDTLEEMLETRYFKSCDLENPVHFMAIWTTRVAIAKTRFIRHLAACSRMTESQTGSHRDAGALAAHAMLKHDTELMSSPLTKRFRWQIYLHFPFPAYVHLAQDLKERPLGDIADLSWAAMIQNSTSRLHHYKDHPMEKKNNPLYKIFADLVLQAWSARQAATGTEEKPPEIISQIQARVAQMQASINSGEQNTQEPMEFGSFENLFAADVMYRDVVPQAESFGTTTADYNGSPWDWPAANWNSMLVQRW